jgi:transposase-like protein
MRVTDKRMLDAIKKNGGAVYLAARELGCAPNTIYNRMEKVPAMKQAVEDARGEVVDYAEQKLRLAVLNGEPWAIGMTLKTIGKSRGYVERQEVTGAEGKALTIKWVDVEGADG